MNSIFESFISQANPGVQGLRPYLPGKSVAELEREYGVTNAIKLASNENPLGPGPKALAAATLALAELTRYPDGNAFELKHQLAVKYQVDESCITIGNGSNEILELLARVFLKPGTNAVFSEHAFAVYPLATQAVGASANIAQAFSQDHATPFGHNLPAMLACINDDTRLVFIANPNNPTGTWLSSADLLGFIEQVPAHIVVVVDEAYFEYVDEADYPDTLSWMSRFSNLVITRTFSKIYGLAALRIGYSLANSEISNLLNRVRQPFNANAVAQAAAVAALGDQEYLCQSVEKNRAGLVQLGSGFNKLNLDYVPSVANFILVNVKQPGLAIYEKLLKQGVIVRPVANYGLPDYLRITVGTVDENQKCLEALNSVLALST